MARQYNFQEIDQFVADIWEFYYANKRDFVWRNVNPDPYHIVVSEIMLQQTQTSRVAIKFPEFISRFKTFEQLAQAQRADVLALWVGLGYNRRAVALHEIAQKVVTEFNGQLPACVPTLKTFKGLGHATASSIVAFAFNQPTVLIETNIRAVFIHSFFNKEQEVPDQLLMPLIEKTVCKASPREWYYALMDYGVHLKKEFKNPSRKSKHHQTQSTFEGSDRQIRGAIIKLLSQKKQLELAQLIDKLEFDAQRIEQQCNKLMKEKMIFLNDCSFSL